MRCLVPARGGIYAQDAVSGGEKEAACMEPDGTQVPGLERGGRVPIILSIGRYTVSGLFPSLWVWHGYVRTVRYARVQSRGQTRVRKSSYQSHVGPDWTSQPQPRLEIR